MTLEDTAAALDPRLPAAASTPFLVHFGEAACFGLVADRYADGTLNVGARVEIDHLEPSPVGAVLRAEAELISDDGRQQQFEVQITEAGRVVARMSHRRACAPEELIRSRLER
ncbi:thioesterase family protein (plasmid) [Nocardioides sp. R1-1]|uniref:thioesterase family protein n=1 Tax=Nocardioides sp. R1-1 TaxID=3383502 RepID=UPI0038D23DDB